MENYKDLSHIQYCGLFYVDSWHFWETPSDCCITFSIWLTRLTTEVCVCVSWNSRKSHDCDTRLKDCRSRLAFFHGLYITLNIIPLALSLLFSLVTLLQCQCWSLYHKIQYRLHSRLSAVSFREHRVNEVYRQRTSYLQIIIISDQDITEISRKNSPDAKEEKQTVDMRVIRECLYHI